MDKYKMMDAAYDIAFMHHKGQRYGKHNYMYHLDKVAMSVGENPNHIAVAYLHDILEDTACTLGELYQVFTEEAVKAVEAITKMQGETYPEYITKVKANPIALHVKIHDTLCNLTESVKTQQWDRVRKYSEQIEFLCS